MRKILSKEQLCYKLNMTPELYTCKKEVMKWWKQKQKHEKRTKAVGWLK